MTDLAECVLDFSLDAVLGFTLGGAAFAILGSVATQMLISKFATFTLKRAVSMLCISFIIIIGSGLFFWGLGPVALPCRSFSDWINGAPFSVTSVFVGMGGNIIFGFIDNAGLFFGISYLEDLFAMFPGSSDANVIAGYGNTFSDFLGAFLGAYVGKCLQDFTGITDAPIWAEAIGVVIGCLLGVAIPKLLFPNKSATMGFNKTRTHNVLVGNLPKWELLALLDSQKGTYPPGIKSYFDMKAEIVFKQLDKDNSETIEMDELKFYLIQALGSDWNETKWTEEIEREFHINVDAAPGVLSMKEWKIVYADMIHNLYRSKTLTSAERTYSKMIESREDQSKKSKVFDSESESMSGSERGMSTIESMSSSERGMSTSTSTV